MYPMAILCGGLGTRLGSLTMQTPKCLIDVHGRPFLAWVIDEARRQGIEEVTLCVGHLADQVIQAMGDGSQFDLHIQYSYEGEIPLGTGAAVRIASSLLGEDFFVVYGDSYLTVDYAAVQAAYEINETVAGMMVVCEPPESYRPNVWLDQDMVWVYDNDRRVHMPEMQHIDYGMGILNRKMIQCAPEGDLSDYYARIAHMCDLGGYLSPERFYTIGTPAGLALTREFIGSRVLH